MIRFIVYEDNNTFLEKVQLIINKVAMNDDFEYRIDKFSTYDDKINDIINDNESQKIYILDVEVPKISGLELASRIREQDWDSMIIFLTSHIECRDDVFYSRLMVLDFISKSTMFKERLEKTIKVALDSFNRGRWLIFKYNQLTYRVAYDNIIYIEKLTRGTGSIIITNDGGKMEINMGLNKIMELLDKRFYRTHKSCIVNVEKVKQVNNTDNIITFSNNMSTDLLSERNRKDFINYVKNYRK